MIGGHYCTQATSKCYSTYCNNSYVIGTGGGDAKQSSAFKKGFWGRSSGRSGEVQGERAKLQVGMIGERHRTRPEGVDP